MTLAASERSKLSRSINTRRFFYISFSQRWIKTHVYITFLVMTANRTMTTRMQPILDLYTDGRKPVGFITIFIRPVPIHIYRVYLEPLLSKKSAGNPMQLRAQNGGSGNRAGQRFAEFMLRKYTKKLEKEKRWRKLSKNEKTEKDYQRSNISTSPA